MPKPVAPVPAQIVRVTYRVYAGGLERTFTGGVVNVVAPGKGPIPRKPGKRVQVVPVDPALRPTLAGWYSVNEVEVIGWHPHVLAPAAHAVLDSLHLAARGAGQRDSTVRMYPARLAPAVNALVRRGLAERREAPRGCVAACITPAGRETLLVWESQ